MTKIPALEYPFDTATILRTRKQLKKSLAGHPGLAPIRIALLGGSTTSELRSIIELFLLYTGLQPTFYESEYGKYFEDATVDSALLREFDPQVTIVHTSQLNIAHAPALFDIPEQVDSCLEAELGRFKSIWNSLTEGIGCLVIQNNFDLPSVRSLGDLDTTELFGRTNFLLRLNLEFARAARENPKLVISDIHHLSAQIGLDRWFEPDYWYSYKMAVSHHGTVYLAHALASTIANSLGRTRKCLALDLDNTLWGGVVGDDGVDGIKIGKDSAQGEAYTEFQAFCEELRTRGILLAVSSKNEPDIAKAAFDHPDMVLRHGSFASFRANWEPKSGNIEQIAKDLNIGVDSLVFVDDNPAERELVRAQLPMVATPEVGSEVSRYAEHIARGRYFAVTRLSGEDAKRASFYAENTQRAVQQAQFSSYADFLQSLDMTAEIGTFSHTYLERICQLTNKTNQFNLTTRRYTLGEMEGLLNSNAAVTLYGRLTDKFGDNGLVTAIAGHAEAETLHIDLWLMSCRVLKRGMEDAMLDALVDAARARGLQQIVGYYYRTPKNDMVSEHYERMGFSQVTDADDNSASTWRLPVAGYIPRNKQIRVNSGV
jgi:FkbH-like protein